jgi:hypothetical protein
LARKALQEEDSLLAYDITQKALDVFNDPGDVELRQIGEGLGKAMVKLLK